MQDQRSRSVNKGFRADTAAFITQVKANLAGYQSGFPVIRELVQNADDGGATQVKLVRLPPLEAADHALFRSPGVLVINNGTFRDTDEQGIRRLGLGRKIVEKDTIGKFGLGLKSVFHLCEVFCFGASHVVGLSGQVVSQRFCDILNPWSGLEHDTLAEHYERWDELSDRDQQMLSELAASCVDWDRWFFVYLPLRKLALCPKETSGKPVAITSNFAGDNPEAEFRRWWPTLCAELSTALPLLRHLESLEQAELGANRELKPCFRLKISDGAKRTSFPGNLAAGKSGRLGGGFELGRGSEPQVAIHYGGLEYHLPSTLFDRLRQSSHWPRQPVLFTQGETRLQSDDKNAPHAAVYFSRRKLATQTAGTLRILRATFLPIGEPVEIVSLALPEHIDLMMHGFFFVDPSRSRVRMEHSDTTVDSILNEEQLTQVWNFHIQRWIYALLPAALHEFSQTIKADHQTMSLLTNSIVQTQVVSQNLVDIAHQFNWECRLGPGEQAPALLPDEQYQTALELKAGNYLSRWVMSSVRSATTPPIRLPGASYEQLVDTFSAVHQLAKSRPVLRPLEGRLSITQPRLYLEPDELTVLLGKTPNDYLKSIGTETSRATSRSERFIYLSHLLRESWQHPPSREWVCNWVPAFLRLLMSQFGQERVDSVRESLACLAELTRPEDRFLPRPESAGGFDYLKLLNEQSGLERCVLPAQFWRQAPACSPLNSREVRSCLAVLEGEAISKAADQLVREVLANTELERAEIWSSNADLRLFAAVDAKVQKQSRYTFQRLSEAVEQRRLFVRRDLHVELESALANALHQSEETLLVLPIDSADLAYGNEAKIQACDASSVARLLEERPQLGDAAARGKLLAKLFELPWRVEFLAPFRYLLHAVPEFFDFEGPLWTVRRNEMSESWGGVLVTLLRHRSDAWKVINPEVVGSLGGDARERLGLRDADERLVCSELDRTPDLSVLNADQRRFLYIHISDDLVLCRLPLHQLADGQLVAVGENTFLDRDYALPPRVRGEVTLVCPSSDLELQERQMRIIPSLGPLEAARIALNAGDPHQHWRFILDELQRFAVTGGDLPGELCRALRDRPWILLASGQSAGLDRLLTVAGDEALLGSFLEKYGSGYYSVAQVAPELSAHSMWLTLWNEFKPSLDHVCLRLSHLLRESPPLGRLTQEQLRDPEVATTLLEMPEELLPAGPLLLFLREQQVESLSLLLEALARPCDLTRSLELYRWGVARHKKSPKKRPVFAQLALHYLAAAAELDGFSDQWQRLDLLTEALTWRKPSELCFDTPAVESVSCLHQTFAPVLRPFIKQSGTTAAETPNSKDNLLLSSRDGTSLSDCLMNLFRHGAWKDCQAEVVGAFYALLSPHEKGLEQQARQLLRLDVSTVRTGLQLPGEAVTSYIPPQGSLRTVPFSVDIDVLQGSRMMVESLLGHPLSVELKRDTPNHLLLTSESYRPKWLGQSLHWQLQFRHFDPSGVDQDQQAEIVWNTLWQIIQRCYFHERASSLPRYQTSIRNFWDDRILKAAQFDIRVAQKKIEDQLPYYIPMLPGKTLSSLKKLMTQWDEVKRQQAEAASSSVYDQRVRQGEALEKAIKGVEADIARLVSEDGAVQSSLLEMVRGRIGGHYQYTEQSIPFELLQNADDASIELLAMEPSCHSDDFLIYEADASLQFGHNGRAINSFRSFSGEEYKNQGFHTDLEKMLLLQRSDKGSDDAISRTGKFGLGFKSVFLACDKVQVRSGNRSFEVLGGMYPRPLGTTMAADESRNFDTLITLLPRASSPTVGEWRENILHDFRQQLPIQLIFLRQIRTAVWQNATGELHRLRWHPRSIPELNGLEVGNLPHLGTTELAMRALVLRTTHGSLLLALTAQGPVPFAPEEFPRCWVTTPLNELSSAGFLFNAPFDVNVARRRLAPQSKANEKKAGELGKEAGRLLCRLSKTIQDQGWERVREVLGLESTLRESDFWSQLWAAMSVATARSDPSKQEADAEKLAHLIEENCLKQLAQHFALIRTGLWGPYQEPAALENLRAKVTGLLAREEVFQGSIPLLTDHYKSGQLIRYQESRVVSRLFPKVSLESLSLVNLLRQSLPKRRLEPKMAKILATCCSGPTLASLESDLHSEVQAVREFLTACLVKNRASQWCRLSQLVIPDHCDTEELRLALLAPPERILAREYCSIAQQLLAEYRGNLQVTADEIALWLTDLPNPTAESAGLRYVLEGERGRDVAARLYTHVVSHNARWISEQTLHRQEFREEETRELKRLLLPPQPSQLSERCFSAFSLLSRSGRSTSDRVQALWEWWHKNQSECVARYEQQVYPGQVPVWKEPPETPQARRDWFVLLALGSLQSLGRQTDHQNRAFLAKFEKRRWLDKLLHLKKDRSLFSTVLDEYFRDEDEQEYIHWLRGLPVLYQLSMWLYEYAFMFLEFDKPSSQQTLRDFLNPRSAACYQGGGFTAPNLSRTMKTGVHFVLRELRRSGTLKSDIVDVHCFAPNGRVRERWMALLDLDLPEEKADAAELMYKAMLEYLGEDKATFNLCFDIPLRVIPDEDFAELF